MEREFEWDEDKRLSTIDKHGIDFLRIRALFDGRPTVNSINIRNEEIRITTTGELDMKFYTVIWADRDTAIHLISARRARDAENRAYRDVYGSRN